MPEKYPGIFIKKTFNNKPLSVECLFEQHWQTHDPQSIALLLRSPC